MSLQADALSFCAWPVPRSPLRVLSIAFLLSPMFGYSSVAQDQDLEIVYRVTSDDFDCIVEASNQFPSASDDLVYLDLTRCPRDPVVDLDDLLTVWRPEQQVPGSAAVNGLLEYAESPLVIVSESPNGDQTTTPLVDDLFGVNIGVPVPREPFSFGGWNDSCFGNGDITGTDGISFWTKQKKITQKWTVGAAANWMS